MFTNVIGLEIKRRLQDISDIKKESSLAAKESQEAKLIAEEANYRSDITKKQLEEAIKNGDQVVEVQTLRVDPITGEVYPSAADRFEANQREFIQKDNELTSKLKNIANVTGKTPDDYLDLVKVDGEQLDWTDAIQALLDSDRLHALPPGIYRITDELVVDKNRVTLVGSGNSWAGDETKDTVIYYDGPVDRKKAVLRLSTAPIGTNPERALTNLKIKNIVLDANGKAGYGLYAAYVTDESEIESITAVNALEHGIRIEKSWYASFKNLVAKNNYGCGITIGRAIYDWGWLDARVNSAYFSNLRAHNNGLDETFDRVSNIEWGYGVGLYLGYNLKLRGVTAENNDGAGVVFKSHFPVAGIEGLYCEKNDKRATGEKALAVVYIGTRLGRGHFIRDIFLWGEDTHERKQTIWLTGDEPFNLELKNIFYGKLIADWSNYTLENAYYGLADYIEGHLPKSKVVGSYQLTTLYVRPNGSDDNNGRTPQEAFKTLAKAIEVAGFAERVTTIDCTGVEIIDEICDFSKINKQITIDGGGTAKSKNNIINSGLTINNAKYGVIIKNFSDISRLITNSSCVVVENSVLTLSDLGAFGLLTANYSEVYFKSCQLRPGPNPHDLSTGLTLNASKVSLSSTTMGNFRYGRHAQLRNGSVILCDEYLDSFKSGYSTIEDSGYIMAGNIIRNKHGVLTFQS